MVGQIRPQHVADNGGHSQERPAARDGGDRRPDQRALAGLLPRVQQCDPPGVGDQPDDIAPAVA